jgi:hypothetical protein
MKKHFPLLFLFSAITFIYSSCKKDNSESPEVNSVITGQVHSPSGVLINHAHVVAGSYQTYTDSSGKFSLPVSEGIYTLKFFTGDGRIFKTSYQCWVNKNDSVHIAWDETGLNQNGNIAYLNGLYDNIQVLLDSMGYNFTEISIGDLSNYTVLTSYDMILMNCGALDFGFHMDSTKYSNLNYYIQNGGSVYISDFSVMFLTGDGYFKPTNQVSNFAWRNANHHNNNIGIQTTCSNPVVGGFIADSILCTHKTGPICQVPAAILNDSDFVSVLGKSTISIHYDLDSWEVISSISYPFSPTITDATNYGCLAAKADLNGNYAGGKIYYTTFHNNIQGTINNDTKQILQYVIMNL